MAKGLNGYLEAQQNNLRSIRDFNAFADLLGTIDMLYCLSIDLVPDNQPSFGRFALVCHKEFLAATSLIGQGQPLDSIPITRRAIDAIRVATAIKENSDNAEQWVAFERRDARWRARREGNSIPTLPVVNPRVEYPLTRELIEEYGSLSDQATHFSPEYFGTLDWHVGDTRIDLNYFSDARTIELNIITLATTHVRILRVLDFCMDGLFSKTEDWLHLMEEAYRKGKTYNDQYRQRYHLEEANQSEV